VDEGLAVFVIQCFARRGGTASLAVRNRVELLKRQPTITQKPA
jgi:hypothetical protein